MFFKVCVTALALLPFVFLEGKVILNKENPGKCDLSAAGNNSIVNDRDRNYERVLFCVKINGKYSWREVDIFSEVSTLGEFFNPAEDCSDIVRKKRDSKSGLYWIKGFGLKKVMKNNDLAHRLSLEKKETLQLKKRVEFLEKELKDTIEGLKVKSGKSCQDIYFSSRKTATSGVYWIQLLEGSSKKSRKAFPVYCDMETHGGGWTLVYSYTFTNYNNFRSFSNAVTPRPNWPASEANVPISTTPPLDESSRGAIDFNLWKEIGKEVLIKSNINDWIVCQPNGGSMVTEKNGPLVCQNIKNVATKCQGIAPNRIYWHSYGPFLFASSLFYHFDGSTNESWPTHDPCGKESSNEKRGVTNPGGAIYIR